MLPVIVLHASANPWTPVAVLAGPLGRLAIVLVAKWLLVALVVWTGPTPRSARSPVGSVAPGLSR